MTSNCTEGTKFKKYLGLQEEKRKRGIKWTHEEDIAMLRGYQIYGAKWQLISIFFLPHRHHNEIKKRWSALELEAKTSNVIDDEEMNSICSLGVTDKDLPALVRLFLHFLKDTDRELVNSASAINNVTDTVTRNLAAVSSNTQVDAKYECTSKSTVTKSENSNGGITNENTANKILMSHSRDGSRIEIPATEFEQDVLDDDDGSNHVQPKGLLGVNHNKERSVILHSFTSPMTNLLTHLLTHLLPLGRSMHCQYAKILMIFYPPIQERDARKVVPKVHQAMQSSPRSTSRL